VGALLLVGALAGGGLGCGALSAMGNPKAAWALNEPAPMSVVIRRAEVARATALQVKRLLAETGVDAKSAWVPNVAVSRETAEKLLGLAAADPVYAGTQMRLVPAEAWAQALGGICSEENAASSLLALISADVDEQFHEITQHDDNLGELRTQLEKQKAALAAKGLSPEQRREHLKAQRKIETDLARAEDDLEPKTKALMKQLRADVPKAPPAAKETLALVAAHLLRAVEEARLANSTAMIRYPLAMPSMSSDVQIAAKRFAADVIEEKTGHRPNLDAVSPSVTLNGTDVQLTLSGVPADKLGGLSADELVAETTKRTKEYVAQVLELAGTASQTQEMLSFQADLLEAIAKGAGAPAGAASAWGDLATKPAPVAKMSVRPPMVASCKSGAAQIMASAKDGKELRAVAKEGAAAKSAEAPAANGDVAHDGKPAAMKLETKAAPVAKPSAPAASPALPSGSTIPASVSTPPGAATRPAVAPAKGGSKPQPVPASNGPDLRLEPVGR
jgi:hypothetical protein